MEEEEAVDHLGVQMVAAVVVAAAVAVGGPQDLEAVEEAQSLPVQVLQARSAKAGG